MTSTPSPDSVYAARSAVAVAVRLGRDETTARRGLATAKLRRAIVEALASSHAPTPEQRAELAELLVPGGAR